MEGAITDKEHRTVSCSTETGRWSWTPPRMKCRRTYFVRNQIWQIRFHTIHTSMYSSLHLRSYSSSSSLPPHPLPHPGSLLPHTPLPSNPCLVSKAEIGQNKCPYRKLVFCVIGQVLTTRRQWKEGHRLSHVRPVCSINTGLLHRLWVDVLSRLTSEPFKHCNGKFVKAV